MALNTTFLYKGSVQKVHALSVSFLGRRPQILVCLHLPSLGRDDICPVFPFQNG